ncbi:hypothetical protein Ciccas_011757 [Cichlidogyrus casuarinus]|uniref:BZIP domain-containing protein n=1 Tax=Cichlidogyrus casuarinus TaxID=1844966 RepID=A0ABD2PQA9_9PLAT
MSAHHLQPEDINNNSQSPYHHQAKSNTTTAKQIGKALPTIAAITSPFPHQNDENHFQTTCSSPAISTALIQIKSSNSPSSSASPRSVDLLTASSAGTIPRCATSSPCINNLTTLPDAPVILTSNPSNLFAAQYITSNDSCAQLFLPSGAQSQGPYLHTQQQLLSASTSQGFAANPALFGLQPGNQGFQHPSGNPYFAQNSFLDPSMMNSQTHVMLQLNQNNGDSFNQQQQSFLAAVQAPDSTISPNLEKGVRPKSSTKKTSTPNKKSPAKTPHKQLQQEEACDGSKTPSKRLTQLPTDLRLKGAKNPRILPDESYTEDMSSISTDDPSYREQFASDLLKSVDLVRIEKKRARNRVAARKCRERKLSLINSLEGEVSAWKSRNQQLRTCIQQYESLCKDTISNLQKMCQAHPELYSKINNLPIFSKLIDLPPFSPEHENT